MGEKARKISYLDSTAKAIRELFAFGNQPSLYAIGLVIAERSITPDLLESLVELLASIEQVSEWDDGVFYLEKHAQPRIGSAMNSCNNILNKARGEA